MRYIQIFLIAILCSNLINAQDPLEYHYLIPSFPSRDTRSIDKKLPIEGWASERITEHLDRGAVAVQQEKGTYLSWRLLNSNPPDVANHPSLLIPCVLTTWCGVMSRAISLLGRYSSLGQLV